MSFKYSSFISYRRFPLCLKCVKIIHEAILANEVCRGAEVFWDEEDIEVRDKISVRITDAIKNSMTMLFLFVPESFKEDKLWCAWELAYFIDYESKRLEKLSSERKNIEINKLNLVIPIMILGEIDELPLVLKDRKHIDMRKVTLLTKKEDDLFENAVFDIKTALDKLFPHFKDFKDVEEIAPPVLEYNTLMEKINTPFPDHKPES